MGDGSDGAPPQGPFPLPDAETVRLSTYVNMLEAAAESSRQANLAWNVGQSARYATGGKVGQAILGSKTLGAGLRRLSEFCPLLQDATHLKLDVDEDWTTLSYRILDPDIWPRHEDAMFSLGIYARLIKGAAREVWNEVEITVEAEQGKVRCDLGNIVHARVIYGGSANALRFPTRLLDCPVALAPPVSALMQAELSRELALKRASIPISERTRQVIYRDMNEGPVAQEFVARELGVSSRTFRRKLAAEGYSYQALLDECRMRFAALEFRSRKSLSLTEMALKLGYSEHSNFSRAFARWTGMAPQEYRRAVARG